MQRVFQIAVTGGIAGGKSAAAAYFAACGIPVFDADQAAHALYSEVEWCERLAGEWGSGILDETGKLNRQALARIVFADDAELEKLNRLVHPELRKRMRDWSARCAASGERLAVLEIPLLFESGWSSDFDATLAVWTPDAVARVRSGARNWPEGEWEARSARQWSATRKLEMADYGIVNSGSMAFLTAQCDYLLAIWRCRAAETAAREKV